MIGRRCAVTLLGAALALLCACSDPVDAVREARIAPDESVTVCQALERYPYFKKVAWNTYEDKEGKIIVEALCDIDVAANCRGVNEAGLKLAQRDVARDYFLARFVVEGFPRKVRPLEARHVTQCASGQRLGFSDPKYLRAIYNREQVRFFCLDGLNCPGQGGGALPPPEPAPEPAP
jgi:hypothetical protein